MFNLEFFKGKINTTTIHKQTPPIDRRVLAGINRKIKEKEEGEDKFYDRSDVPKFYETQILHDGTAYRGEWLNCKRHGDGILYKLSSDNVLQKIFEGSFYDDLESRGSIFYDTDSIEVEIIDKAINKISTYTRNSTDIHDCWTANYGFNEVYIDYKEYWK